MSRRRAFGILWAVLIGLPVALEVYGLASAGEWDMLSEHVIPFLLSHPLLWGGTLAVYVLATVWLGWHWWFQYRRTGYKTHHSQRRDG